MSLVVPCTACPAQLSAPEGAEGKQIWCPRCGTVVDVPAPVEAEEVPVVDAKPARVRPKPVVVDEDEDRPRAKKKRPREAEDEPPPRRRKTRKPAKRGSNGTAVLIVVVSLLLVGGVAAGAFFLARKGGAPATNGTAGAPGTDSPGGASDQKPFGFNAPLGGGNLLPPADPAAPAPAGWQQYSYPDAGFKAYFPKRPLGGGKGFGEATGPTGIRTSWTDYSYYSGGGIGAEAGVTVKFWVIRFSHGPPVTVSGQFDRVVPHRPPGLEARRVRWLGYEAWEADLAESVVRVTTFGNTLVAAQVVGPHGTRPQPHELAGFFTNVELTK